MADRLNDGWTSADRSTHRGNGAGDFDVRSPDGSSFDARDSNAAGESESMPAAPITQWGEKPDLDPDRPTGPRLPRGQRSEAAIQEDLNVGDVIRKVNPYPEPDMGSRVLTAAVAGLAGAAVLTAIAYLIFWSNGTAPTFVAVDRALLGRHGAAVDHLLGIIGFLAAGAIWGGLFGVFVRRPIWLKGCLFGLAPTLFLWLVMAPLMGKPLFMGGTPTAILMPLLMNVVIWGSIVGRFSENRLRPPSTAATTANDGV